jgi:hypothetical protein
LSYPHKPGHEVQASGCWETVRHAISQNLPPQKNLAASAIAHRTIFSNKGETFTMSDMPQMTPTSSSPWLTPAEHEIDRPYEGTK